MMVNEKMYQLGSVRSAIRELFEYGKERAKIVGAENVYDFSIGNPSIPAPEIVNETIRDLTLNCDSVALHGYTSAQGDIETRQAIADFLNKTHGTNFNADNFYITMGAAASLSLCFRALTTSEEDETADAYIERFVHDARDKYRITVVSSDGLIQQTILSLGGLRMSSRELKEDIDRTGKVGFEQWQRQNKQ